MRLAKLHEELSQLAVSWNDDPDAAIVTALGHDGYRATATNGRRKQRLRIVIATLRGRQSLVAASARLARQP